MRVLKSVRGVMILIALTVISPHLIVLNVCMRMLRRIMVAEKNAMTSMLFIEILILVNFVKTLIVELAKI